MWPWVMQQISPGQGKVGGASDVKTDIELRDLHHGFFTGDAVANDMDRSKLDLPELLDQKRTFRS